MRSTWILITFAALLCSCGGGASGGASSSTATQSSCAATVTGTVIDSADSTPVAARSWVTLEASFAPFHLPEGFTRFRPIAGARPDSAGRFSLCVPASLAGTSDMVLALAAADSSGLQYGPTVVTHVAAGDVGRIPIGGSLGPIRVVAPTQPATATIQIVGRGGEFQFWVDEPIDDPRDVTRKLRVAVPILDATVKTGPMPQTSQPVSIQVASQAFWVCTTVTTAGGTTLAYSQAAAPPNYDGVTIQFCQNSSIQIPGVGVAGGPMYVATPGATLDFASSIFDMPCQ